MTSAETSAASFDPSLAEPKGWSLRRWLAPFAVGIALLSAFLTFVVLTGLTPIEPTREVVRSFLLINAATILLLVGIILREIWQMVQARRRGRAAARLHVQIVSLFSVIAVLPAVLVAIVANVTIEDHAADGRACTVRSKFVLIEYRREQQRIFAGAALHRLVRSHGRIMIAWKRVDLVNCDAPLDGITIPF